MHPIEEGQVILIDKPFSWSSFDVVRKLKSLIKQATGLKKFKIGHAGTLDPYATGLLIICTGRKTKTIAEIQALPKTYSGTFVLGATTPTYDLEVAPNTYFETAHITPEALQKAAASFLGESMQTPPAFSARKIEGKRAYELARKGEEVKLLPKPIHIYKFEINAARFPEVDFEIMCSKGTYIRSIAHDFGQGLQSGAYLSALRRTQIGSYHIQDAFTLPQVEAQLLRTNDFLNPEDAS